MGVGVGGVVNYANVSSGTASDVVAYGGVGGPYEYCSFFSVLNWFAKGEPGAWYDPSDLTTLFQDSAGTTPVTAVEQPVGLMLDKSKGLALGVEVNTGNVNTILGDWTQTGGVVTASGTITASAISFTLSTPTVIGNSYLITIPSNISGGTWYIDLGPSTSASQIGTLSNPGKVVLLANNVSSVIRVGRWAGSPTGTIGTISVKQIAGNHAFQATAGNRPVLSARVNLLTYSKDFRNTATAGSARPWVYSGITLNYNAGIAPDNTLTAGYLAETTATAIHILDTTNTITLASIGSFTYSVCFKKGIGSTAPDWIQISTGGASNTYANFNLTTGLVGNFGGGNGITATNPIALGDGWYRCSITLATAAVGVHYCYSCFTNNTNAVARYPSYGGQITSDVQTWGADLRPTNSGALLPPYQRVNTASDYDTVGFPLYLKANGSSSAMSTNSIDFSSTDKMTVVTGVRKLSALSELILELSADTNANTGAFYLGTITNTNIINSASKGTVVANVVSPANYPNPISFIETLQSVISQPLVNLRLNNTQLAASLTGQGIGNFGNYPLYLFARAGTLYPFTGQFYGAIIRGAQSDTASVTQTENYMATKTGITF